VKAKRLGLGREDGRHPLARPAEQRVGGGRDDRAGAGLVRLAPVAAEEPSETEQRPANAPGD
jgi:hypothetical protein